MIINLTPHTITIRDSAGGVLSEIPASGSLARVEESIITADPIDGIRCTRTQPTGISGLPDYAPGVYYVVSLMAADGAALFGRETADLLVPGQQTRDESGRINGCASLVRYGAVYTRISSPWKYCARVLAHTVGYSTSVEYGHWAELTDEQASKVLEAAVEIGDAVASRDSRGGRDAEVDTIDRGLAEARGCVAVDDEHAAAAKAERAVIDRRVQERHDQAMRDAGYEVHRQPAAEGNYFTVTTYRKIGAQP